MDLNSLFSISDNLYKFMFIGGIVMIIFSITFPMQKKQLIDIEVNTYNQQAELLNKEISDIKKQVKEFKNELKTIKPEISIRTKTRLTAKGIDSSNMKSISDDMSQLEKKVNEMNTKSVILKYNLERVKILKEHIATYDSYTCWLTWIGIFSGVIGFILWLISTINTEKLKIKEINKP